MNIEHFIDCLRNIQGWAFALEKELTDNPLFGLTEAQQLFELLGEPDPSEFSQIAMTMEHHRDLVVESQTKEEI
jgi:hypothetical protein